MTTQQRRPIVNRLFSTVGSDNDRIMPWRTLLTSFPVLLVVLSLGWWALHHIGVGDDGRAAASHLHPGPMRGAVYLAASIIAITVFTAVTRRPRRPAQDPA